MLVLIANSKGLKIRTAKINKVVEKMVEKKFYSDIRFVKIENLKGRAKEIANANGLTNGLAFLKVSVNSVPEYEIEPIRGDPLDALKELAARDGITQERLNKALEEAAPKE
jgi:hypothetical protein